MSANNNLIAVIKQDHALIKNLYIKDYKAAKDTSQKELLSEQLHNLVALHHAKHEQVVKPLVDANVGESQTRKQIGQLHQQIMAQWIELDKLSWTSQTGECERLCDEVMADFIRMADQHESNFLPVLQSKCTANDLSEAARMYEAVKTDLPHPKAPAPSQQQVGGAGVGFGAGVGKVASEERSKEQHQYAAEQSR